MGTKVSILLLLSFCLISFAEDPIQESVIKKLQNPIHTHFGAFNWDILDFPQKPAYPLHLIDVKKPDAKIDVLADLKGKVVVLVEIEAAGRHGKHFWNPKKGEQEASAVSALKKFCDEHKDKNVVVYCIWYDTDKKKKKDDKIADAKAFADKANLPCPMTVEVPLTLKRKGRKPKTMFQGFCGARAPGHPPANLVCILDPEGQIVYRGMEYFTGFSYHTTKHIVDRLLDPEYDKAVRSEFASKRRALPVLRVKGGSLKETFESYPDNHQFKLEPRWGFRYETQSRLDMRASLVKGEGRDGSTAALVDIYSSSLGQYTYPLEHKLPGPLKNGTFSFFIRRKPTTIRENERPDQHPSQIVRRAFVISFGKPGSFQPAGYLMATGDWGKETFVMDFREDTPGKVSFEKERWHLVSVECKPGEKAIVSVDKKEIGKLNSESIDWIGFRTDEKGKAFYVDNVEIIGGVSSTFAKPEPAPVFTREEQEWIQKDFVPVEKGKEKAQLDEGAVPRADTSGWHGPYWTFDHPVSVDDLVLENLNKPGELVNVSEKYKGKIIWVTKLLKGDHTAEKSLRPRTTLRSLTVFNRVYALAKEYKAKGVVVIGVACYDGGHRDTVVSYEERKRTAFDVMKISEDLLKELQHYDTGGAGLPYERVIKREKNHIIYGSFPEAYDEVLMEMHVNQIRIWNKTLRGKVVDGSFAGFGDDAVIAPDGKVVYRGTGPDGFQYWKAKFALDRLLDPEFDKAVRQDLRNPDMKYYRSSLLPIVREKSDGLLYRDGFQRYQDVYDFGLSPAWGFGYTNPPNEETGYITQTWAVHGRQFLLVNKYFHADVFCGNSANGKCAKHILPEPLENGYVSFIVKRGPSIRFPYFGGPPLYRIGVVISGEDGTSEETLTTIGEKEKEAFQLVQTKAFEKWSCYRKTAINKAIIKDTQIPMAQDEWQKITILCKPGVKAELLIDDTKAADLSIEKISAIDFRGEVPTGTYVDDFEVFYKGDAALIRAAHEKAVKDDFLKRKESWSK